ncbi:MAG: GspH/FimT family protein [Xanthomonadales bacterium]|nr:GspH/FimT family protein [Xanthomonadales bacterium]
MRQSSRQSGFSLVEILAVLVVVGLLFGLVGGSLYRSMDAVKIRRAGKEVVNALRHTRAQAIVKREEQFLEVDIEERSYRPADGEPKQLPDDVDVTLRTASMDILNEKQGRIRFYPDGSSTGGEITLMSGSHVWRVRVAWLTGEITLEASKGAS